MDADEFAINTPSTEDVVLGPLLTLILVSAMSVEGLSAVTCIGQMVKSTIAIIMAAAYMRIFMVNTPSIVFYDKVRFIVVEPVLYIHGIVLEILVTDVIAV